MGTRVGRWLTGELVDLRYWERGMQMDTLSHFFPCWVSSLMTRNTLGLLSLWCLRVLFASPCKPHHLIFISNQYLSISCPLLRQPRFCKENGFLCVCGGVCVWEREREREIDVFWFYSLILDTGKQYCEFGGSMLETGNYMFVWVLLGECNWFP